MNMFLYFIIFPIVIFVFILLLSKLRKKTTIELERILFIQNNPELYLQLIKNPRLKILYRKSTLLQFELNAYLLQGKHYQISNIMGSLDMALMSKGEKLEYQQKKLSYYCTMGREDKSEAALKAIESILSGAKGEHAQFILKESKMIFDIYIRHNTGLIEELEQAQRNEQGITRGLTLYRLAKLSYYEKNDRNTQDYLLKAKELLVNTVWSDIVESALKDKTILNYK